MKRTEVVNVVLEEMELPLPKDLYRRLEMLASMCDVTIEEYITNILSDQCPQVEKWKNFSTEAQAVLQIYNFCFSDVLKTLTALKHLRESG